MKNKNNNMYELGVEYLSFFLAVIDIISLEIPDIKRRLLYFWGKKHINQLANDKAIEYQFLFWRIDCKSRKRYYISLRHYDYFTTTNQQTRDRKIKYYEALREFCDKQYTKDGNDIFEKFGERKNYKESDLLFIPVERINKLKEQLHIKYGDRNLKLLQEFDYAIENDFVDKFYLGCKGC